MTKSSMPGALSTLHNVPKNRHSGDLDHRLGFQVGFFRKAGVEAPA